jgi:SnoaL-like domain
MPENNASEIALRFVDRINAHDVTGLLALMTPDHCFIDSLGNRASRPMIEEGWKLYFKMVPDYWIKVNRSFSEQDMAVLIGEAGGTYVAEGEPPKAINAWRTPGAWLAKTKGAKIVEWSVFADNEPIREKMRQRST